MRNSTITFAALAASALLAGCGSSGPTTPTVLPARVYSLIHFRPAAPVLPGKRTAISFTIQTPSATPLTQYKTCCDPHAGVDLIVVRRDDSHLQYVEAEPKPDGTVGASVVFPTPGRYRITVDAYPKTTGANTPFNFQLFKWVTVRGRYRPQPLPPYRSSVVVDGYRFTIQGHPRLKAIQPSFLVIHVTDPAGRKAVFMNWRGALAHAIFLHEGDLAYSHTHVCKAGATYCFSAVGNVRVTGHSTAPGVLRVGVLLPEPGTWRLFLLTHLRGRVITVPFTLHAK